MQKVNPEPEQAPDCQVDDRGHKSVNGAALSLELTQSSVGERGENDRVPVQSTWPTTRYYFHLIIGYLLLERRTLIVQCLW